MNPNASVFCMPDPTGMNESTGMVRKNELNENDKLWEACLSLCNGDREKATIMIENPDELLRYSEIRELFKGTDIAMLPRPYRESGRTPGHRRSCSCSAA